MAGWCYLWVAFDNPGILLNEEHKESIRNLDSPLLILFNLDYIHLPIVVRSTLATRSMNG